MVFTKLHEALWWFRKYTPYTDTNDPREFYANLTKKAELLKDLKMGEWVLFRHIAGHKEISRPILGMFVKFGIWDQALVFHFVEEDRAWMSSHEISSTGEEGKGYPVSTMDPEMQSIQFWTDDILVLGRWGRKPTTSDLRWALDPEKEITYGDLISSKTHCPTCGSEVSVGGSGMTHYYIPKK